MREFGRLLGMYLVYQIALVAMGITAGALYLLFKSF